MKVILCSTNSTVKARWHQIIENSEHQLFETASIPALITLISREKADLVLMHNLCAPPETAGELVKMFPGCKFMLLSNQHDDEEGIAYLRAGVSGFASTYIRPERLLEAIKIIVEGGVWVGQRLMEKMIADRFSASTDVDADVHKVIDDLTDREKEVAQLIASGVSNKEIASQLDITERTVKAHLNTIYKKTNTSGRLQLALLIRK